MYGALRNKRLQRSSQGVTKAAYGQVRNSSQPGPHHLLGLLWAAQLIALAFIQGTMTDKQQAAGFQTAKGKEGTGLDAAGAGVGSSAFASGPDFFGGGPASALSLAPNYTLLNCSHYDITYSQIERDLDIHHKLGTSLQSTRYFAKKFGGVQMRGLTVGFFGGEAYLLTPTSFANLSHHAPLHLAYMRMLLHVAATFGTHLPDVTFVLTTSDTPRYVSPLVVNTSVPAKQWKAYGEDFVPGPYPALGVGKSDYWPDLLLVPIFHFHMKLYDNTSLGAIPHYNGVPWSQRLNVMFGRFSRYRTNRVSDDPYTLKAGRQGRRVCYRGGRTCPLREHFIDKVVPLDPMRLNVSFRGKLSMFAHTGYKYLLHLDGQGISSRLEQLLPMRSLVFKQRSGYYAYYYNSLLRHRKNLVEFWWHRPEDVLEHLDWAEKNDEEARRLAEEGQRIAATYLTGNGRTCYWYRLLHGLRATLSYTPELSQWPEARPLRQVVEQQLLEERGGKELNDLPWMP